MTRLGIGNSVGNEMPVKVRGQSVVLLPVGSVIWRFSFEFGKVKNTFRNIWNVAVGMILEASWEYAKDMLQPKYRQFKGETCDKLKLISKLSEIW